LAYQKDPSFYLHVLLWLIETTHRSTCIFYFGLSPAFSTLDYLLLLIEKTIQITTLNFVEATMRTRTFFPIQARTV
jgi:hypothetical protein